MTAAAWRLMTERLRMANERARSKVDLEARRLGICTATKELQAFLCGAKGRQRPCRHCAEVSGWLVGEVDN